jgi:hypothetical protein
MNGRKTDSPPNACVAADLIAHPDRAANIPLERSRSFSRRLRQSKRPWLRFRRRSPLVLLSRRTPVLHESPRIDC